MRKRRMMIRRRRRMMRRRRRWRGRKGMRRICRTACWWRRALLSFRCISCYKVLSANKKLNNHIVEMHNDPASCILCYTTFERRTFSLGTALCTFHHHTPANCVEMLFGGEKASYERQRETGFTSVRGCSQIMSVKNGGSRPPPLPPFSAIVSIFPTPPPPFVSRCQHFPNRPSPLCHLCQYLPNRPLPFPRQFCEHI